MKKMFGSIATFGKRNFLKEARNEGGNVAIMVAIALPFLVLAIGGGADYARTLAARSKLQAALDSATLATYKRYAGDPAQREAELQPYFDRVLKSSLRERFERQIEIVGEELLLDTDNSTLRANIEAKFPTTFMRLVGIDPVVIRTTSEVKAGMNFTEVALVLDVTGSMEGARLDELKRAAKSFLDTVNAKLASGDPQGFKVSIVPFAEYVNVGMDKRNAPWIRVDDDVVVSKDIRECRRTCDNPQTRPRCRWEGNPDVGMREVCEGTEQYCPDGPGTREECTTVTDWHNVRWEGCVGSRNYPDNLQDEGYGANPVPGVMNLPRNPDYPADTYDGWQPWPDNNCPAQPIMPLTPLKTNIDDIKSRIDALQANGFTYIPIGLAWGWRVLSNNGPDDPFNEGADDETVRNRDVRKIIILMTDGMNRMAPNVDRPGWSYRDHSWRCEDPGACDASQYADERLAELCARIKEKNPATGRRNAEIITITFDVSDNGIKTLLRECSSMGSYDAQSGQLSEIFESIASSLAELHISR